MWASGPVEYLHVGLLPRYEETPNRMEAHLVIVRPYTRQMAKVELRIKQFPQQFPQ
jgi:hypothetical protein